MTKDTALSALKGSQNRIQTRAHIAVLPCKRSSERAVGLPKQSTNFRKETRPCGA